MSTPLIQEAVVFLAATVIAVPLFKKLGMGAVLGYLIAGVLIGPWFPAPSAMSRTFCIFRNSA